MKVNASETYTYFHMNNMSSSRPKPYHEGLIVPLLSSSTSKDSKDSKDSNNEDLDLDVDVNVCSICLSNDMFTSKSWVIMKHCPHTFHRHCIDLWLESHETCPLCMQNVYTGDTNDTNIENANRNNPICICLVCLGCCLMSLSIIGIFVWVIVYAIQKSSHKY